MSQYDVLDIKSIPSLVSSRSYFSDFFTFTPHVAQNIIDNHMYNHQRPISKMQTNQFANAMKSGIFAPVSTITFAVENGSFSCIDGQHTLRALVQSDTILTLPVMVINDKQHKLYSKIDRGRPRVMGDTLRAYDFASTIGLSQTATNKVARAMKIILAGHTTHPASA